MDYEYEYGRYKKKVADQQKEIAKLREECNGYKQILQANDAIIAAMLRKIGADEFHPLVLPQETINEALEGNWTIMSMMDNVAMVHMVYVREDKKD